MLGPTWCTTTLRITNCFLLENTTVMKKLIENTWYYGVRAHKLNMKVYMYSFLFDVYVSSDILTNYVSYTIKKKGEQKIIHFF